MLQFAIYLEILIYEYHSKNVFGMCSNAKREKMGWRHALLPIFTENNENASTFKADPINELWAIKRKKLNSATGAN